MTRIAVTCIQLIRDLAAHREPLDLRNWEITTPLITGQHLEGSELVAAVRGCVGVVAGDDRFTADVLAQLPELKVISKWGIGIDGIDLGATRERGIVVRNTPGTFDDEVADVAMAYITMLHRELVVIDRAVRRGIWAKPAGHSLRGRTVGVIGLGGIGRAVARRALTAGMRVSGFDPDPASRSAAAELGVMPVDLPELYAKSDVISVNCPLNEATRELLDADAFAAMRDGVYVVNTGRGAVVATDALVGALHSGKVAGCALDVMEEEPVPAGRPLTTFENVIFGSHNASNTLEASARVHDIAIANLIEEIEST